MFSQLLQKQRENLEVFFQKVVVDESAMEALCDCKGTLIFCGVGKSGFVAEKIAMTCASTGTRAHYLSVGNALHGDIGVVREEDIVVMLSRSGETPELLSLVDHMQERGAQVHAWVCREGSTLAKRADVATLLPMENELCPYNLAPTTSAVVQMLFGDAVAVWLMEQKGFSLEEYQKNHPGGQIGKRIGLKVEDLMLKGEALPTCSEEALLGSVLVELTKKRCGCLVVVDNKGGVVGILTDGDLRRALQTESGAILLDPVRKWMTKACLTTRPAVRAEEAKKQMQGEKRIMMLPVVEEGRLVGLLHMHDIIQVGL